jgi:putative transposase
MTYNRKYYVKLSDIEITTLETLLNKGALKSRITKRILGLLHLSEGKTYEVVSSICLLSKMSLHKLAHAYQDLGIDCIYDKPRSGRPIEISAEQADKVITLALETAPEGHSQWSLRLLADKVVELGHCEHISHTSVNKVLKKRKFSPT